MQKVVSTEIIQLDRSSQDYKKVMSEFLKIEVKEKGEELANASFENVNEEFANGTRTNYTFDDGLVRCLIQLNFLSPTYTTKDSNEYSNHIQNWSLFAVQEEENMVLTQSMELHTFCMHEGGH